MTALEAALRDPATGRFAVPVLVACADRLPMAGNDYWLLRELRAGLEHGKPRGAQEGSDVFER